MNDTKTEFITFGTSNLLSKMTLTQAQSGITVNCLKTVKFLGGFLDETLSLREYVAA